MLERNTKRAKLARMNTESVRRIVRLFGSQKQLADDLEIWQTAISGWVQRGTIPARWQARLLVLAQEKGIELSPADFFQSVEPSAAEPAQQTAA